MEHLVLNMLRDIFGKVSYWTDIYGNEIDFIIKGTRGEVHTVECKINPDKYSPAALKKFREYYTKSGNYCFSPHIKDRFKLRFGDIEVNFQSFPE